MFNATVEIRLYVQGVFMTIGKLSVIYRKHLGRDFMIPNRRMKSRFWKLEKKMSEKKRPKKEEKRNRQSRMTLLTFLSRLQIENYVMTDFSIRKKRTANNIFPTTGSCCKISISLC